MSQPEADALQKSDESEEQIIAESPHPQDAHGELNPVGAIAQSLTAKILIVGFNALTGVLSARALEPAGRGALTALILWPVFLGSSLTLGIPSALTYQLRRNRSTQPALLAAGLLIGVFTGILGAVIGALFLPYWIPQYSPSTIFWARILVLSCPMQALALVGRSALESADDFSTSNTVLLSGPMLTALGLGALILTHHMSPAAAGCVYVASGLPPLVWMLRRLMRRFHPSFHRVRASARLLLGYGIASYGVDLCGSLALYVDQAIVVRLLAPEAMGTYVVALSVSRMLNIFSASVAMVLFPRAVGRDDTEVAELTGRAARMTTLLTGSCGVVLLVLGPQVLTLLYSARFRVAGPVLRVLVVEVVLASAATVLSQAFMALGRPGVVTALQVLGLGLTVPLMLVFVPHFGIVGAGLALLCSTALRLLFVLASFAMFLKVPVPRLAPVREDFAALARFVSTMRNSRVAPASR